MNTFYLKRVASKGLTTDYITSVIKCRSFCLPAALDPLSEYEVYSKFNEIAGGKTAIYISHRLASCRFCDKIAVFHTGEVVQKGTHEELFADRKGKYCELWNAQSQYYTTQTKVQ